MSKYIKFECPDCGERHDCLTSAEFCCPPPMPRQVFVCPECACGHDDERFAAECCGSGEDALYALSHAELEAAGQMRLIP